MYVAIADIDWSSEDLLDPQLTPDPKAGGGLMALRLADGKTAWEAPPVVCAGRDGCSPAQTAAVTAIPGVVFSGSISGHLRAFSTKSGALIWEYDTVRDYETVNGAAGRGGALDATGPVIVDGVLYLSSGLQQVGRTPGERAPGLCPERVRAAGAPSERARAYQVSTQGRSTTSKVQVERCWRWSWR